MGENKSITIDGFTFRFEVNGVMHVSLYSGDGESAHAIKTAEGSKEVVEALDIVRGWVKPRENRPFTGQELKF